MIDEIQESGKPISRKIELIGLRSKIIDVHGAILRNAAGECIDKVSKMMGLGYPG